MAKVLTCKDVAQVDLDERNAHAQQRIANSDACVSESAGVEQNETNLVRSSLVYALNDFVFCIALKCLELMAEMREKTSSFCLPDYVIDTPTDAGKVIVGGFQVISSTETEVTLVDSRGTRLTVKNDWCCK